MSFICDIPDCGKNFSCKKTLKEHERTHTGERPYTCPLCQTTFAQYSSLQKHQRVHDKKKPYQCKYEGCEQAFSQISNLIRHERIHTGEKPYMCSVCKKKFASGSNLKQHMQVHSNDETRVQYKCFCKGCDKAYLYLSSLKKHLQVTHPIEYEQNVKTNKIDLNDCKEFIDQKTAQYLQQLEQEEDKLENCGSSENTSNIVLPLKRFKQEESLFSKANSKVSADDFTDSNTDKTQQNKRVKLDTVQKQTVQLNIPQPMYYHPDISRKNSFQQQSAQPQPPQQFQEQLQHRSLMPWLCDGIGQGQNIQQRFQQQQQQKGQDQMHLNEQLKMQYRFLSLGGQNQHEKMNEIRDQNNISQLPALSSQAISQLTPLSKASTMIQYSPFQSMNLLQQSPLSPHINQQNQAFTMPQPSYQQQQQQQQQHLQFQQQQQQQQQMLQAPPVNDLTQLSQNELVNALKDLNRELQQEADATTFQKIQQYVLTTTALAMQLTQPPIHTKREFIMQQQLQKDGEDKIQQVLCDLSSSNAIEQEQSKNQSTQVLLSKLIEAQRQQDQEILQSQQDNLQCKAFNQTLERQIEEDNNSNKSDKPHYEEANNSMGNNQKKFQLKSQSLKSKKKIEPQSVGSDVDQYFDKNSPRSGSSLASGNLTEELMQIDNQSTKEVQAIKIDNRQELVAANHTYNNIKMKLSTSKDSYYDCSIFQDQQPAKTNQPSFEFEVKEDHCGGGDSCCGGNNQCNSGSQIDNHNQYATSQQSEYSNNINNEFKEPAPKLNKTQTKILQRNKDQVLQFFSKLPCIKTCMTKVSFGSQDPQVSSCGSRQIGFEKVEDDFDAQSHLQLSSSDCRQTCDPKKICPEILPTNCDDYYEKKCSCTVYCKKTIKFLEQFVKDDGQIAEIEDLCSIKDQNKALSVELSSVLQSDQ